MQISIVLIVDVEAVLEEGSIEGNAHLVDNTQAFSSVEAAADELVTNVAGVGDARGRQVGEAVLNWVPMGVASLPTTILPRNYTQLLQDISKPGNGRAPKVPPLFLQQQDGAKVPLETSIFNTAGQRLRDLDAAIAAYIPLAVTAIHGPAVDEKVMFPALYGSPDLAGQGWYWSASIDTGRVGKHVYYMDVLIHRLEEGGVLVPETYTVESSINVSRTLGVNGFNDGVCPPLLPLPYPGVPLAQTSAGEIL